MRWEHHSQVLQGQSISGLSDMRCDSCREPYFDIALRGIVAPGRVLSVLPVAVPS